jgi:SAM-dependent methyltransferase
MLRRLLAHPLTRGLDIDAPETTELRRRLFREKKFLSRLYAEYHALISAAVPQGDEPVLELGAGGSLNAQLPKTIHSEVFPVSEVTAVLDAQRLPFSDGALRGIVMINVLHHVQDPRAFFREAARCVKAGGVISFIEPWVSTWSRFVCPRFHYEPFNPDRPDWRIPAGGPLSACDLALAWVIFHRDRKRFEEEFPEWTIRRVQPDWALTYMLSGGTTLRALAPGWTYGFWRRFEKALQALLDAGMLAHIVLERSPKQSQNIFGRTTKK